MSTLRDPVGPKDRKVYIRRRLVVLAVLLAIVAVVVLVVLRPGSSSSTQDAREVDVPSDLAEESPAEDAEDETPICSAGQLVVLPKTDRADYPAGETPEFSLTVENTGDEACSADLGTAGMELSVTSGDDQVWRSTDCQQEAEHLPVIIDPGQTLETETVSWDRTRSSPETCEITRDPVSADGSSYHLDVAAAGVQGTGTAQFLLY